MRKVILTTLALTLTASAFWPGGGVKVVQTPESISNPQMVYLEDGSVIISWEADRLIYCQKLDTTGVIHWDASGVRVCLSDSNQLDHHMVTDGQDVWFVWQDERNDDGDIYAQKISGSTGQRLWGDLGKAVCVKNGTQRLQTCTVLSSGSFVATWDDYSVDPRDIASQWLNVTGQPQWGPDGIYVTRGTGGGYKPKALPSGEAVLDIWLGVRSGDTVGAYFAQRVNSDGDFLWDTMGVRVEFISTPYAECSDGLGGAVVLFGNPGYLGVQRIDSTGQVVWDSGGVKITEFTRNNPQTNQSPYPEPDWNGIISDDTGGCFVWSGFDVQHINSNGNLVWGSSSVPYWESDGLTYRLAATRLCPDGNNGLMIVFDNLEWTSPEWPPYVDQGIRVQRINADGEIVFDTNGIIVRLWNPDSLPGGDFNTSVNAVPGGVILAWTDNRHLPDYSLYAQIVDTTGKVGSGIEEKPLPTLHPSLELNATLIAKNISLRYSLPAGQAAILQLFDVSGRLVRSQRVDQPSGKINWNVHDLSSGVYFAELRAAGARVSRKVVVIK
ncbi:T9SS type A sorting domain-containing protein [candidate division WOR-3 bacterium]|nr:T9SS type A sorting domain-containing protein [candidate division WOR-3 bacterium]